MPFFFLPHFCPISKKTTATIAENQIQKSRTIFASIELLQANGKHFGLGTLEKILVRWILRGMPPIDDNFIEESWSTMIFL
ncbi:MAG: hypothetical protein ACU83V_09150 [Gammaproteobacteria bacterium]